MDKNMKKVKNKSSLAVFIGIIIFLLIGYQNNFWGLSWKIILAVVFMIILFYIVVMFLLLKYIDKE